MITSADDVFRRLAGARTLSRKVDGSIVIEKRGREYYFESCTRLYDVVCNGGWKHYSLEGDLKKSPAL